MTVMPRRVLDEVQTMFRRIEGDFRKKKKNFLFLIIIFNLYLFIVKPYAFNKAAFSGLLIESWLCSLFKLCSLFNPASELIL